MTAFRNPYERALWLMAFATTQRNSDASTEENNTDSALRGYAAVVHLREAEIDPEHDPAEAILMLEEMQRDDR